MWIGLSDLRCCKVFPKARITGVDVFRHSSVSELSMDKAMQNMKPLGIDSRTSFLKHDLTKPLKSDVQYDLAVSNPVSTTWGRSDLRHTTLFSTYSCPEDIS